MQLCELFDVFGVDVVGCFVQQLVQEQVVVYFDFVVDVLYGQFDIFGIECFFLCEYVLIDVVDECVVEIEQK